ncbi:hypothetical protein [Actinokineospora diospyrosa]|uniref:Excreted virulence factor EspC (Type VII ESX diderm) n=1 Tax=Actinokineospora diospyrosa TaxID=103728 RepID=A0ABT1IGI6_9PSEU|nr:hypothetical protein [Actinokineospora diospyrosa]MCP2271745.1 hypothetical protein [Actinokineospora diospyrosa]
MFDEQLSTARELIAALPAAVESTGARLSEAATAYDETERANTGSLA